ncbi:MAG TPA: hypothetical protein VF042_00070 [Gemmatimonadaceae bacterium]
MAKKLVIRAALLGLAIFLTGFVLSGYDTHADDNSYVAAVLEKDRLIRTTPSPKIIMVGGSNLAFGTDSKLIQDSLGINVINMGLYAKIGLRYMLAQVTPYIQQGDVVLVVPEYDQFYGKYIDGDNTLNTAMLYTPTDRIPDFIRSYSIIDVILRPRAENARRSFMRAAAGAVGKKEEFFPPDTNPVYNRHSFNKYGDAVAHLGRKGMDPDSIFVKPLPPMKEFNNHAIDVMNDLSDAAEKRGARAYFMFPSYIDRSYAINVAAIDSLKRKLESGMKMPIVGTPMDFVLPKAWFFDTRYHLNAVGRQQRTLRLIQILRSVGTRDGWLRK